MEGMEDKIGSILGNPEMMQKIMAMAQSLNAPESQSAPPAPEVPPMTMPQLDLGAIHKISGIMGKTNIDRDQRALLAALGPYLSKERIHKLENAMRAAKIAGFAASALQQGGQTNPGR